MPALPSFAKLQFEDPNLNRVQDRVKVATDALIKVPLLNGTLTANLALVAGSFTPVPHNLGRRWVGYIIIARDQNASVWNQAPLADADQYVYLQTSVNCNVTLWVF